MKRSYRERYYEQLALRNALSAYFERITSATGSTPLRDRYENFKPVFDEFFKLVNNVESHKLNVRRLAKLMDQFSETLMSSGSFTQRELSAFWADNSDSTFRIHSARLKRMGATTLSAIVEQAATSRRTSSRPRSRQSAGNSPRF